MSPAGDPLRAAVEAAFGALLADRDVSAVWARSGGAVEVVRRGRRETLLVPLEDALVEALEHAGAKERTLTLSIDRHRLVAGPVEGGGLLLYLEKAPRLDAKLSDLVDEGLLQGALAADLLRLLYEGHGLVLVGPARSAGERLAAALGRELSASLRVAALTGEEAEWLAPTPKSSTGALEEAARSAVATGADVLFSLRLPVSRLKGLLGLELEGLLLASVRAASAEALLSHLGPGPEAPRLLDRLASQICVVGMGPDGKPRVVEHHAPGEASAPPTAASTPAIGFMDPMIAPGFRPLARRTALRPRRVAPKTRAQPAGERPSEGGIHATDRRCKPAHRPPPAGHAAEASLAAPEPLPPVDPGLPPLEPLAPGPPEGWASDAPDDDPGWELSGPPGIEPAPAERPSNEFDRVLDEVKRRPTFRPRPPAPHPQARMLRGDPFGGLTFEPPGGFSDDEDAERPTDEEESS